MLFYYKLSYIKLALKRTYRVRKTYIKMDLKIEFTEKEITPWGGMVLI